MVVRAALRAVLCAAWMALLLPVQIVAVRVSPRLAKAVPQLYHRGNCYLMGIDVKEIGMPAAQAPVLFVVNHASYLDIVVLGAVLRASFVAKQEVAGWPLFGMLAKLQRSVFVARRTSRSRAERDELQQRLEDGDSIILFPEGTSNNGNRVMRFNSTFFSIAERAVDGGHVLVQPVTVAYTDLNGLPIGRANRPLVAWYGDMDLMGHLWVALGLGTFAVKVIYHRPVTIDDFGSRKAMAAWCQQTVSDGLANALNGQPVATNSGHGAISGALDSPPPNAKV